MSINKSDLAASGRWIRDHFSNWFANSFVMVGVFAIIVCSIIIGMYFDGAYARRWSPDPEAETIFRNYGWLISLAMVFFTAAGLKAFQEGARFAGSTLFIVGLFFTVLSATQSIGVVTLKAQQMMASADAFKKIEDTDTTRLDFLKGERQEIIDTRNSEIARIEKSIDAIRFDDIPGIPKTDQDSIDNYNARIDTLRNEASAKIAEIGDEIKLEMETPESTAEVEVAPARFDPGIEFWAYVLKGPEATDKYKEGLTYWYMLFWSIGCPIMGQMLAVYLVITRRTSQEATKKDPVRVEAGKKAAKTKERKKRQTNKITLEYETYIPAVKRAKKKMLKNPRYLPSSVAKEDFRVTEERMREILKIMLKYELIEQDDVDVLLRQYPVATEKQAAEMRRNSIDIINPDPSTINGSGEPHEGAEDDTDDDASGAVTY